MNAFLSEQAFSTLVFGWLTSSTSQVFFSKFNVGTVGFPAIIYQRIYQSRALGKPSWIRPFYHFYHYTCILSLSYIPSCDSFWMLRRILTDLFSSSKTLTSVFLCLTVHYLWYLICLPILIFARVLLHYPNVANMYIRCRAGFNPPHQVVLA